MLGISCLGCKPLLFLHCWVISTDIQVSPCPSYGGISHPGRSALWLFPARSTARRHSQPIQISAAKSPIHLLLFLNCSVCGSSRLLMYNLCLTDISVSVHFFQVYLINVTYSDSTSHIIYRRYSKFFDLQVISLILIIYSWILYILLTL